MFDGVFTAIVTPFQKDGSVDYGRLRDLIEFQIENGVQGVVPVGTTGESPTLDYAEHDKVIETAAETARGRVKVIAGTGGNSTEEALMLTRHAKEMGVDGTLQVTPYYNKPSQRGLVRHFQAVADVGLPVVLYNVPGRTALAIEVATVAELAKHPNIVAIKEAGGDVNRVSLYRRHCDIAVLSGDDALTLPMMALGARGVISVASNVIPGPMSDLVAHALAGRWAEARALHDRYHRLMTDLFIDTNPVPVKTALALMGRVEECFRLPLCEMAPAARATLEATLRECGLI